MNIPEQPEVRGDAAKVLRWINFVVMSAGAMFAFAFWQQWRDSYNQNAKRMEMLQESMSELKKNAAIVSISLFTKDNWIEKKQEQDIRDNTQDTKLNLLDRRVEKVEDASLANKESLKRIETTLGSNPQGKE